MKLLKATGKQVKRVAVGIAGGLLLIVGIIAIPYPGPGWLIVFAALAILASEFEWARRVLHYVRDKYNRWEAWMKKQNLPVKLFFWTLTIIVVIMTLWLLNAYGLIADFFGIDWDWVRTPLIWD